MGTSGLKEYLGYQNHNFRWGHLLSAFSQSISIYWVDEGKGFLNKEISKTGIVPAPTGCQWFVLRNKPFCKIILSCNTRVWTVQLLTLVQSDSLWPHGLQHDRPPCPSPTPGTYSNACPTSWWCHPTISSSVVPFFSCLQSFPASGSFPMSQFFTLGGQSIGVSASTSVLPINIQD